MSRDSREAAFHQMLTRPRWAYQRKVAKADSLSTDAELVSPPNDTVHPPRCGVVGDGSGK